ncbi:hypothetical protein DY000_02060564 [Brassica cretica]|uniref:Uncharacterized protein n=1 Tax=Brassica cretica TaxID=69181 RepID=A0ABQ7AQT8_BRACR|nr:hypothetical protein DY000_02060564 [Brassica cretica]
MSLLAPRFFVPLLLPFPPEPPPPLVFLQDLPVACSSCDLPDSHVPPDPPDLLPSMCHFLSSAAPATPLFGFWCYPAPSSSSMFNFGTTDYMPHGSQIYGYSLVVLAIRSEMFFGWVCEALFSAFDLSLGF